MLNKSKIAQTEIKMNHAIHPWKSLTPHQLKFIHDVMNNHEYADLAVKYPIAQIQDRFDWMWNACHLGQMTYSEAVEAVLHTDLTQEKISDLVSQRVNQGSDSFFLGVGKHCFYKTGSITKPVQIKAIEVDLNCANGGAYPINVIFENGENVEDEWIDCFGYTMNGGRFLKDAPEKIPSPELLASAHQHFLENLYSKQCWTDFVRHETNTTKRIEFAKALWKKFQERTDLIKFPPDQQAFSDLVEDFAESQLKAYE